MSQVKKENMPIIGYYGPHRVKAQEISVGGNIYTFPSHLTDELFSMLHEVGINTIVNGSVDYSENPDTVKKVLELAEKHDIGIYVHDSYILSGTLDAKEIEARINEYSGYQSYIGNMIRDEPGNDSFEGRKPHISDIADIYKMVRGLGAGAYVNLLPRWIGEADKYYDYLEEFIISCEADYVSYDHYPFHSESGVSEMIEYFANLSLARKAAGNNGAMLWTYVQAGAHWDDSGQGLIEDEKYNDNHPTKAELSWNIATQLAFGAKAIQYFPLIQPEYFSYIRTEDGIRTGCNFDRIGLLAANGKPTKWYTYAKDINKHIQAVEDVLMKAENVGVIFHREERDEGSLADWNQTYAAEGVFDSTCEMDSSLILAKGRTTGWRQLINICGEAVVGCFDYMGHSAFYVVNYDMKKAQNIVLEFDKKYEMTMTQKTDSTDIVTNQLTISMEAGEGVLVVIN